jgi:hypothetical protein
MLKLYFNEHYDNRGTDICGHRQPQWYPGICLKELRKITVNSGMGKIVSQFRIEDLSKTKQEFEPFNLCTQ